MLSGLPRRQMLWCGLCALAAVAAAVAILSAWAA